MENSSDLLPRGSGNLRVFVLHDTQALGCRVCEELGVSASAHEERAFDDGEHKARPLVDVRGCDVYVVQSLHGDPLHSANDKLCRLLFFIGALRDAAAARVTAVVPYLAYARKDKRTQANDPVTTRYVAALFEGVGTGAVITVDVHNVAAFQNAFRCHTEHIETQELFAAAIAPLVAGRGVTVIAPDAGASHRAKLFRQALSRLSGATVGAGFAEKHRSAGALSGELLVGDVNGKDVVIVDDLIGTGATLARTAASCRRLGAVRVIAAATHGLFTGEAATILAGGAIDQLLVTDTVPPFRLEHGRVRDQLVILGVAPLLAGAIRQAHAGPCEAGASRTEDAE
jgi:ribose-phosphate pyrophosphokinase